MVDYILLWLLTAITNRAREEEEAERKIREAEAVLAAEIKRKEEENRWVHRDTHNPSSSSSSSSSLSSAASSSSSSSHY